MQFTSVPQLQAMETGTDTVSRLVILPLDAEGYALCKGQSPCDFMWQTCSLPLFLHLLVRVASQLFCCTDMYYRLSGFSDYHYLLLFVFFYLLIECVAWEQNSTQGRARITVLTTSESTMISVSEVFILGTLCRHCREAGTSNIV